jgi:hypothetical protein
MFIQLLLALRIRRNDSIRPIFKTYIYFEAIIAPAIFAIYMLWPRAYMYAFVSSSVITSVLTLAMAADVYRCIFGPRMGLPPMVPERTAQLVAIAISGAVALAVFLPSTAGGITRSIFLAEQSLSAAAWAVFLILLIYSISLRIAWPRDIAGLALGFVLYLTIDVLAVFTRARGSLELQIAAGTVSRITYLLALSWWTIIFWQKEPLPLAITPEELATMRMYHRESLQGLARARK